MAAQSYRDAFYSFSFYMHQTSRWAFMNATFFIHSALPLPARAFVPFAVVPCGRGIPASVPASLSTCTCKALGARCSCLHCDDWCGGGHVCGGDVRRCHSDTIQRGRQQGPVPGARHSCAMRHASHSVRLRARHKIDSPCITEKIAVSFDAQAVVPGQHARRARVIVNANHVTI